MTQPEIVATSFIHPCLDCGLTVRVVNGQEQTHHCEPLEPREGIARAWWEGFDAASTAGPVPVFGARDQGAESPAVPDEAVEAAAEAIRARWNLPVLSVRPHVVSDARAALAAAVPALHAAWAEAEDRGERVSRALSHHWVTSVEDQK